jgi:hypothetical protein
MLFLAHLVVPSATSRTASDPVGVYGLVARVDLLPDAKAPTRALIHGAFAVAVGAGEFYTTPAHGWLLFETGDDPAACVAQWRELQALAGKKQVLGFSSRHGQAGVVLHQGDTSGKEPGRYSTWLGLQRIEGVDYGPARALRLLPAPLSPVPGAAPNAGKGPRRVPRPFTFTAENCLDAPEGARYAFSVETSAGEHVASQAIAAGAGQTSWTTTLSLLAGDRVTWRVHLLGADQAPVATTSFTVGEDKGARR